METVCTVGNMTPFVRPEEASNALTADTGITNDHDPPWFGARANWRVFLHGHPSSNKSVRVTAIANFAFFAKVFMSQHLTKLAHLLLRKSWNDVRENLPSFRRCSENHGSQSHAYRAGVVAAFVSNAEACTQALGTSASTT